MKAPTQRASVEPPISAYKSMEGTYPEYSDAAIVTFTRNSGEGRDQARYIEGDNGRTGLSLSSDELNMLQYVCNKFDKVVVIINSANAMELGFIKDGANYHDKYTGRDYDFGNVKAAIWVGGVGSTGCLAVADILQGEINPSGHLVDTYARDLTRDPTFQNFGSFEYTNLDFSSGDYYSEMSTKYFVEYEEGIYVGYRYYETAAKEAADGNYDGFKYDDAIVYPFGYSLSYTTFDMKYDGTPAYSSQTNKLTFTVKVTNTGNAAGKQVVQIYCSQPYSKGGIEKSHVILAGYAKTKKLEPGASEVVTIKVDRDYIASYDYKNNKCYVLDKGDYYFYLSENAHSWADINNSDISRCYTYTLSNKIIFNKDNKRPSDLVAAVNQFDDETNFMFTDKAEEGYATNFSRTDFKNTFPTAPTRADAIANDRVISGLKKYDVTKEKPTTDDMPITDYVGTRLQLIDLRGKDFDDPAWDVYMKQFSVASMYNMFKDGAWVEHADEDQGVPESIDMDGPYGFFGFGHGVSLHGNRWYQAAPVTAATWNNEMAELMGDVIAEEANNQTKKLTGWYGSGSNTHRSAFGGRNYEYFSEDPLLSGYISSYENGAAANKGVITFVKHYALNEQETNRQGVSTWANEQAIRELYIKPWEIYIKNAKKDVNYYEQEDGRLIMKTKTLPGATGIMTSYNRVGTSWSGNNTAMTVNVLRNEWNFLGTSLTDAGGGIDSYMNTDKGLRTGGTDLILGTHTLRDYRSPSAVAALQQAVKRILYNKANSNAVIGLVTNHSVRHAKSPWQRGLNISWVLVALIDLLCIILIVHNFYVAEKNKH